MCSITRSSLLILGHLLSGYFVPTQLCNGRGCYEHPTGFLCADHFHSEIIPYTRIYNNNNNNIKNTTVCVEVGTRNIKTR